jgi:hypothetical protein
MIRVLTLPIVSGCQRETAIIMMKIMVFNQLGIPRVLPLLQEESERRSISACTIKKKLAPAME